MQTKEILFRQQGQLGVITLNRPHTYNALTMGMCTALTMQLNQWAKDDTIKAVVIHSNHEKAFCAGGDLRAVYENGIKNSERVQAFFQQEYRLNHTIAHFPKPYVALCNGITMGGGVGISIHGSHRVGGVDLKWSMPETGIGFFTDVGATYFLGQLPGSVGMCLGLTGSIINGADALRVNIIDYLIPQEAFGELIDALAQADLGKHHHEALSRIIHGFALIRPDAAMAPETFVLKDNLALIDECFSEESLDTLIQALSDKKDTFCEHMLKQLMAKSPTSLQVVFTQLHDRPEAESINTALKLEYRIAARMLQNHDFYEGIRAQLIDKDYNPNWQPNSLKNIEKSRIAAFFAPLEKELDFSK